MKEASENCVRNAPHVKRDRSKIEDTSFLKECFLYDPETGVLTWKERPVSHFKNLQGCKSFNVRYAGKKAGTRQHRRGGQKHHVCMDISRNGFYSQITAHKAAWIWSGNIIPDGFDIDHENGDPWDNRFSNLRLADKNGSSRNRGEFRRNGKPRKFPKGVNCLKGRFLARIRFNYELFYLGSFDTPQEASEVYEKKARELFGEFYRPKK